MSSALSLPASISRNRIASGGGTALSPARSPSPKDFRAVGNPTQASVFKGSGAEGAMWRLFKDCVAAAVSAADRIDYWIRRQVIPTQTFLIPPSTRAPGAP
jgi:hypothetical protein